MSKHLFTLIAFLSHFVTIQAQTPTLVKNIGPGNFSGILSTDAAVAGNSLYFLAFDVEHGTELWKTDGTEAGTVLVKDMRPGDQGGQQKFYSSFHGQLYLTAFIPGIGTELWRTDDTDGVVLLQGDFCPGSCNGASFGTIASPMAEFQGKLFFQANNAAFGAEPWTTDGTEAGTSLFRDINPGANFTGSNPYGFTVLKDKLFFVADSSNIGSELWVTDGTAAGTRLVKNINTSFFGPCNIDGMVPGEDAVFFWARNSNGDGKELWRSDGTEAGTIQIKDIWPGSMSGQPSYVPLTNSSWLGDKLLFTADDGVVGPELWSTDGTEAGTQLLADINPGPASSTIKFLASFNGMAYFLAKTDAKGQEIWASDGTPAGTKLLKDINPGAGDGMNYNLVEFVEHNHKMYFTANNGSTGRECWVSDGTESGTQLLFDLYPGPTGSDPSNFQIMGGNLYFVAETSATGRELWKLSLGASAATDIQNGLDLKIYPTLSPDGVFQLQYSGAKTSDFEVRVFDALGRQVFQGSQAPNTPLRLSNLSAGNYVVRVSAANGQSAVQKVVINP